jgi:hypothetical protein
VKEYKTLTLTTIPIPFLAKALRARAKLSFSYSLSFLRYQSCVPGLSSFYFFYIFVFLFFGFVFVVLLFVSFLFVGFLFVVFLVHFFLSPRIGLLFAYLNNNIASQQIKSQGVMTDNDWKIIGKDGAKRRAFNKGDVIVAEGDRLYRIYQVTKGM